MNHQEIREIRIDPVVPSQSVLISTARGRRPAQKEPPPVRDTRAHVAACPFCRGNEHLTPSAVLSVPRPQDWTIRVVENPYPLLDDDPLPLGLPTGIQRIVEGYGHHEVIIDHPDHGIALHEMSADHLASLFTVYQDRMHCLYDIDSRVRTILAFKNFGKAAGGSMPHTHSQLIAMPIVPHNVHDELESSLLFYRNAHSCVFCTLVNEALPLETITYDRRSGKRRLAYDTGKYLVDRGERFVAIKPFASRYEWEVHILPWHHQSDFLEATADDIGDLVQVLRRTMARLTSVLGEMNYNYFLHTVPRLKNRVDFKHSFHWHLEICPRVSIPSGFELGSGLFVNSVSPEEAAARLARAVVAV